MSIRLRDFQGRLDSAILSSPNVREAVRQFVTASSEARQMNKTLMSNSAKENRDYIGESGRGGTKRSLANAIHSSNTGRQKKATFAAESGWAIGQHVQFESCQLLLSGGQGFAACTVQLGHFHPGIRRSASKVGKGRLHRQEVLCRVYLTLVKEDLAKPILGSKYANTYDTFISKPFQRLTGREAPAFNFKNELGFSTCQKCFTQVSSRTDVFDDAFCSLACFGAY